MNLFLCLLLTTQKPGTSQPNLTGWEVPAVIGAVIGLAIAKFGVQDSKGNISTVDTVAESKPEIPVIEPQQNFSSSRVENGVSAPALYDWEDIADEAVGFIIAGNSGSAKTSVACWLAGHLTKDKPAQMLALDPHANRNPLWKELGITVINDFKAIEKQLKLLVALLDQRRSQPENGDEIIVFADELGACLLNFKSTSGVQIALQRLGSEGRKYGITFIALNQSKDVGDIGISGAYRNNYVIILLGAAAQYHADRNWKQDDARYKWVYSKAYPCLLSGSVPDRIARHPTHDSYNQFKKKGNPPKGILPINQLPLTIELAADDESIAIDAKGKFDVIMTATDVLPEPLRTIWRIAQDKEDWLTVRDISRKEYAALKGKNTAAEIIDFVRQLERMGLIEISCEVGQAIRFRQVQKSKAE